MHDFDVITGPTPERRAPTCPVISAAAPVTARPAGSEPVPRLVREAPAKTDEASSSA